MDSRIALVTRNETLRKSDRRQLARRLRDLRRARSLTTRELSAKAGVSASLISLIETEKSGASLTTLRRLAAALAVPVVEFLIDPDSGIAAADGRWTSPIVVRRQDRRSFRAPHDHAAVELVSPDTSHKIEFLWFELDPEHEFNEGMMSHRGEEQALVLSGTMHLTIGEETYILHEGDSILFDSSIPHRVENRGSDRLIQVSAITPPRF
jgi:transcriptional regulator with XRE-family HTH domain